MADRQLLSGWGRTAPTASRVVSPTSESVARLLAGINDRGVIARGLGRSYGDAAQNAGGTVLDMTQCNQVYDVDARGLLTCDSGASLDALMRFSLPRGWFVPVSPGTRYVTVGGAIAADVHGKNHHGNGTFSRHVASFDIALANGETRSVDSRSDPDLFWATTGGMGLTGVVLRATIQMVPVDTAWMLVDTVRCADLDHVMSALDEADTQSPYSVAWIDCLAGGRQLGRGVVDHGSHAQADALPSRLRSSAREFESRRRLTVPNLPFPSPRPEAVRVFNEFWFQKAPKLRQGEVQQIQRFFHPLDGAEAWNRIYGKAGLIQYQFVVPFGEESAVEAALALLRSAGTPPFLAVLKRFGPAAPGLLSFPRPGWTLALDFPARAPGLAESMDRLDDLVVSAGGSTYLAKDSRMGPSTLEVMYPRLGEFRDVRAKLDPDGILVSDLARRLGL